MLSDRGRRPSSRTSPASAARVDPDQWFPVARNAAKAREEAADAIAVCAACPVRGECLEFALRHDSSFGGHGVWGGMVEAERHLLRLGWLEDSPAGQRLQPSPAARARNAPIRTAWPTDNIPAH